MQKMEQKIFEGVSPIFEKFRETPHVEFEFRFGKIVEGGKSFDTNVGKQAFEKTLRRLKKYKEWESVQITNDMVYSGDGLRLTVEDVTDKQVQIFKRNLFKQNFPITGSSFDVRFSVSTETPSSIWDAECAQVVKQLAAGRN